MSQLYPWQRHQDSWSETCPSIASALEALQQASQSRPWQELSNAEWDYDGLKFHFHWRTTRRLSGRRVSWSDGTFFDGFRSIWNAGAINLRESQALEKGNYTYRRVSLPHEFGLEITLSAPRAQVAVVQFVLTEEIDPDQTVSSFQHGAESVASRLAEVESEFRSSFNPYRLSPMSGGPPAALNTGHIQRLTPAQAKAVVNETIDRCVSEGWLPRYERTGKFKPPRHKSPIVSPAAWELAHYAQRSGPLYDDDRAWSFAYELIESFMFKGVTAGNFTTDLPNVFGPLKGVQASWLSKDLQVLFGQCGFSAGPAAPGGFDAVFHARGSAAISDLPEPYGKWLQLREQSPRWSEKTELEISIQAKVDPHPKSGEACLSLRLSTFAPTVVERLALAIKQKYNVALAVPSLRPPNAAPPVISVAKPPVQPPGTGNRLPSGSWKF
jgi:hypothetical protein